MVPYVDAAVAVTVMRLGFAMDLKLNNRCSPVLSSKRLMMEKYRS